MKRLNVKGLMPRSVHEYQAVLDSAVREDDSLDLERIDRWSNSRRTVLRAALKRVGLGFIMVPRAERRARRKDLAVPTEREIERLKTKAWSSTPRGERSVAFLLLVMGLRSAEALGLTRRAVERALDSGELVVTRKGDYEARLPSAHAAVLLAELLEVDAKCERPWRTAGEILSCGGPGTQYVRLYRLTRSMGAKAGIRGLRPHLLRHAFATDMIRKGAPIPIIQRALGHASQTTTFRYFHPSSDDVQKYLTKFEP